MPDKIVILTGAGMSAESGIRTFRDSNGLWENHRVEDVASPEGFLRNPELVYEFYNLRRRQLKEVEPNQAHKDLVKLESKFDVSIVTQNIDDLHERAGSSKVIHLHGELRKVRSLIAPDNVYDWTEDLTIDDRDANGHLMRPHIVWFGEAVPMIEVAANEVFSADYILIIGTSMQVYPAAGLVGLAKPDTPVFYIDPEPKLNHELKIQGNLRVIAQPATVGVTTVVDELLSMRH